MWTQANLFGLHEPHFRVLFREIGLKLPGRKARKTFERAAEGPSLTRATFLHALVRLALRASKKRPHQAISKLWAASRKRRPRPTIIIGRSSSIRATRSGRSARTSRNSNASSWCTLPLMMMRRAS